MTKDKFIKVRCDVELISAIERTTENIKCMVPAIKTDKSKVMRILLEDNLENLVRDIETYNKGQPISEKGPLYKLLMSSEYKEE